MVNTGQPIALSKFTESTLLRQVFLPFFPFFVPVLTCSSLPCWPYRLEKRLSATGSAFLGLCLHRRRRADREDWASIFVRRWEEGLTSPARTMPIDGHGYLTKRGWAGKGSGLRVGSIARPIVASQKRDSKGLGKDRDDHFEFWDQYVIIFSSFSFAGMSRGVLSLD